jgi:acetylornithine deacetylase/succinyl-diaminopimelate desuccinylase-like protein
MGTLVDSDEDIAIKDFAVGSAAFTPGDEDLLKQLGNTLDEKVALGLMGAKRFKYPLHGTDLLRKYLFSSVIQVDALDLGDPGTIPPEARALLTIRLAPGMPPEDAIAKLRQHLASRGCGDIEVKCRFGYPGSRTSLQEPVVRAMLQAYRYHGCEPAIWPLLASATPYYMFRDLLGIPYVCGGLGSAGRSHAADEYASLEGLKLFEKSLVSFLYAFAMA